MIKMCSVCKIKKELGAFHLNKNARYGVHNKCKVCKKAYDKEFALINKTKRSEQQSQQRKTAPNELRLRKQKSYLKNRTKAIATVLRYAKENPDKKNAIAAKRHAAKLQRTPPWLTELDYREIEEFYNLAQELQWLSEDRLEVDHIIPLQGKNVSGLHVPWNLQILPRVMNASKGNRYDR